MSLQRSIHPFPARMAPDLAIEALGRLAKGSVVLDPMAGSGTVLRQAMTLGHTAIGYDLDPLAVMMSKVWTAPLNRKRAELALLQLVEAMSKRGDAAVPWIDKSPETLEFVEYWFAEPQRLQLRRAAAAIAKMEEEGRHPASILNFLKIALSKTIVTKENGASLARDVSHSRPHRVATSNEYDVCVGVRRAADQILSRLDDFEAIGSAKVYLGDARKLALASRSVDFVLTSPPYLNAIDYMRGHRLSLVWLGYSIPELRGTRSSSIGAERGPDKASPDGAFAGIERAMVTDGKLIARHSAMVRRYAEDVYRMMSQVARVMREDADAVLVVGNSCLKGVFVQNSEGVAEAARQVGLCLTNTAERELPGNQRYLPISQGSGALDKRMRTEVILTFRKAA